MKTMDEIIHMDDWKSNPGIFGRRYSEYEIKVMMRRYGEGLIEEFWKYLPSFDYDDDSERAYKLYTSTIQEIQNQVII